MTAAPASSPTPASVSPPAPAAPAASWRERLDRWAPPAAVAPLFLLFLIFKVYGNYAASSDENIYFYMSVRTAFDGLDPYKDYFFAHPPLHIYLSILVFKAAAIVYGILHGSMEAGVLAMTAPENWAENGFALSVAKWIPMASGAIACLFVYKAARRAGPIEGFVGAACFILAHDILRPTSHFTGVAEAAMFTAIGIDRLLENKDRQAGLAFAAGCLVAMYVAPAGLAVWLVLLAVSLKRALRLALWTGVPILLVHAFFLITVGFNYWDQVFLYHVKKPEVAGTFGESFWPLLYHNSHLFFAAPTAVVVAVLDAMGLLGLGKPRAAGAVVVDRATRRREARKEKKPEKQRSPFDEALVDLFSLTRLREDPRRQVLVFALFAFVGSMIFILSLGRVFQFYFVMAFVSAGTLAGYAYGGLLRAAWQTGKALVKGEPAGRFGVALALIVAVAGFGEWMGRGERARGSEVPANLVGRPVPQFWREAQRMGFVNGLLRSTFWEDQQILGEHYTAMTYYAWHESRVFEVPTVAAQYIRATTPPDAKIFGDSTSVPLAALMSGRRLVPEDEADTNAMRFSSNITPSAEFIARLRKDPPMVILAGRGRGFFGLVEFQQWMQKDYDLVQTIQDRNHGEYYLFRRRGT